MMNHNSQKPNSEQSPVVKTKSEASFTLIETIMAMGLMVTVILNVSSLQGNAINSSHFQKKMTQGIWLAKSVMSRIEYKWKFYDIKDIKDNEDEREFEEELCPKDVSLDCDFKYSIHIEKWDLPLIDLALGGQGAGEEEGEEGGEGAGFTGMVKEQMKTYLGDEILKTVHVEVFWPEGSRRESVDLAYLLTAQQKLDQSIETLKAVTAQQCKTGETLEAGVCVPSAGGLGANPALPGGPPPGQSPPPPPPPQDDSD